MCILHLSLFRDTRKGLAIRWRRIGLCCGGGHETGNRVRGWLKGARPLTTMFESMKPNVCFNKRTNQGLHLVDLDGVLETLHQAQDFRFNITSLHSMIFTSLAPFKNWVACDLPVMKYVHSIPP